MERKDAIQNAYKLAGANSFYDGMITCSTVGGKAVCHAVWGMGKAERLGLSNVHFQQGDVGALPFADGSFDTVVSLNGFHAFPDKEAAYREICRVLKPGGMFCGCFYVKGSFARTDWFIRYLYQPMKFFTPPYETVGSLKARLEEMYDTVEIGHVKGIAWFICRKGGAL